MSDRQLLIYFSWSRPGEASAPIETIDDRFPAVFEVRRTYYPKFETLSDAKKIDQGIGGFLDHIQKPNFQEFADLASVLTGRKTVQVERVADDGSEHHLDEKLIGGADTIVVIGFDSLRTGQEAMPAEIRAIHRFLDDPDHALFVCPHHDIGEAADEKGEDLQRAQLAEHIHHGDPGIPPRQGFGLFARTLLAGLGVPIENRFGLRPAMAADGGPAPVEIDYPLDVLDLLRGVETLNLHPHLPQMERMGPAAARMDVLVRQAIDMTAPPHPFTKSGRVSFDALLQSRPETFPGKLLVCDATTFSSTAGGLESLRRLWSNLLERQTRR